MKKQLIVLFILSGIAYVSCFSQENVKTINLIGNSDVVIKDMKKGVHNDLFIAGNFRGNSFKVFDLKGVSNIQGNGSNFFLAHFNALGQLDWLHCIQGGSNNLVKEITVDDFNNLYVCGTFRNSIDMNPSAEAEYILTTGNYDGVFYAKYNEKGILQWASSIKDSNYEVMIGGISIDKESNIYLFGSVSSGYVDFDPGNKVAYNTNSTPVYIAKYSYAGEFIKFFNTGNQGYIYKVLLSNDNLFVAGGRSQITKFGKNQEIIWEKNLVLNGSYIEIQDLKLIDNDVLVLCGFNGTVDMGEKNFSSNGSYDFLLASLNGENGNLIWGNSFGGSGWDNAFDIEVDNNENIFLSGEFSSMVDFNPQTDINILTSEGDRDIFLAQYSSNGNYVWAGGIGNSKFNSGTELELMNFDKLVFMGWSTGSLDIDFTDSVHLVAAENENSLLSFIAWTDFDSVSSTVCDSIYTEIIATGNNFDLINNTLCDTIVCFGQSLMLEVSDTNVKCLWNTRATGSKIEIHETGSYSVINSNYCETSIDSVYVLFIGKPKIDIDQTTVCTGDSIELTVNFGNLFLWNNGKNNQTIYVNSAGEYYAFVEYLGYSLFTDTVEISEINLPTVDLGNDTILYSEKSLKLDASNIGASYLWNTGSTASNIDINQTGIYSVEVSNSCGTVYDSINVSFLEVPNIHITNVITPNADGYNDTWIINNIQYYENVHIKIWNSDGTLIYSVNNYDEPWDGYSNGSIVPNGSYYYIIELGNINKIYTGNITVYNK